MQRQTAARWCRAPTHATPAHASTASRTASTSAAPVARASQHAGN